MGHHQGNPLTILPAPEVQSLLAQDPGSHLALLVAVPRGIGREALHLVPLDGGQEGIQNHVKHPQLQQINVESGLCRRLVYSDLNLSQMTHPSP